jgi:hypothetical protein
MRRFPLHALRACTCAVLLVGCQSAVDANPSPPSPPPPSSGQSLSFEISGPSQIDASGAFSWEVFAFGGSGQYQYQWVVTNQAGQLLATTTERRLSLDVADADGDLVLTLTVSSGYEKRVESFDVANCIGGC